MSRTEKATWVSVALAAYALFASLLALVGWTFDIPPLADWDGDGISMQPNPAVAAVLAAIALVSFALRFKQLLAPLGVIVLFIGGATLFEHISGNDLGIDTLLFEKSWGQQATVAPGRMGPPASTSFTFLGLALLLLSGVGGQRGRAVAPWLALVASLIALEALIGYLFGANQLYTTRLTGIAWQTATIILALGLGLTFALTDQQPVRTLVSNSGAGLLARRAILPIIVVPIAVGWLEVKGQEAGLFDTGLGTALLVLMLIVFSCTVLGWGVATVAGHEQSLAAVHEESVRAETVLSGARDQFTMLDEQWRYSYVNARVTEITGMSREDLLGKTVWEVWPTIIGTPFEAALRRTMERRESEMLEYFSPRWNRWYDIRLSAIPDGGVACFILDITDRKNAEEALRDADRHKDEWLAMLAHELRNPLAPISTSLEVMQRAQGDASLLASARSTIQRQVGQLIRLVDDLLDVSRIRSNRLELRRKREELGSIIQHAVETCRPLVNAKGHRLEVTVPAEPVFLHADAARLAQVFGNLLTNACKYTERDGLITLAARREGDEVAVVVRDTGLGIPSDMLPRIFDLFVQVDRSLERTQGGLGVGLTLVKRLVELHGGRVEARSDGVHQGSEFEVRLPVLHDAALSQAAWKSTTPAASAQVRRVLVVDDNRDAAKSLATLLKLSGHETVTAHDGSEAVERASAFKPDIILLDIGLPSLNGYDACRRIRQEPWGKEITIVAITGWGQDEDRRRTMEAGFNGHLVKPVQYATLLELLSPDSTRERQLAE